MVGGDVGTEVAGERLPLAVVASGMLVTTAPAVLQGLWFVAVLVALLLPHGIGAPRRRSWWGGAPGADGPDDEGGGGLRGRPGPRPTRPSGVK
jgi:hypothetical protein